MSQLDSRKPAGRIHRDATLHWALWQQLPCNLGLRVLTEAPFLKCRQEALEDMGPCAGCLLGHGTRRRGPGRVLHTTWVSHLNHWKKLVEGASLPNTSYYVRCNSGTKSSPGVGNRQHGIAALQGFRSQQEKRPSN